MATLATRTATMEATGTAWIKPRPSTTAGSKGSVFVHLPFVVVTHKSGDQSVNVLFCAVLEPEAVEPAVPAWILLRHLF